MKSSVKYVVMVAIAAAPFHFASAQGVDTLQNTTGVNSDTWFNQYSSVEFDQAMSAAQSMGGFHVRIPAYLDDYNSNPNNFVSMMQGYANVAAARGQKVLFEAIMASKSLVSGTTYNWPQDTPTIASYKAMVNGLLAINGGSDVELGYEPNLLYSNINSFAGYFTLVNSVAASRARSGVGRLVGPGVTSYRDQDKATVNFVDFTAAFVANCGKSVDAYSVHMYGNSSTSFSPEMLSLPGQITDRYSLQGFLKLLGGKPFLVTETGADTYGVTEAEQASMAVRAAICLNYAGAQKVDLYELRDRYDWERTINGSPPVEGTESRFGLVRNNFSPKPAYLSLQKLNGIFGGYRVTSIVSIGPNLWQATLKDNEKTPAVRTIQWSSTIASATAQYPHNPMDAF